MARKKAHEEHANHEAWAIPYGDLVTLLLAFFVVMYAVSSVNEGKYRVLSDSLLAAFHGAPRSPQPIQVGERVARTPRDETLAGLSPSQINKLANQSESPRERALVEMRLGIEGRKATKALADEGLTVTLRRMADAVESAMTPLIDSDMIRVTRRTFWVEVEIKTDILFPSGSAAIQNDAIESLEKIAEILAPFPNPVRIEGHTDDVPISNSAYPSNWELSAARASGIVRLFADRGVLPTRMVVAGMGQYHPVETNESEQGRNRNRRVSLVILDSDAAGAVYEHETLNRDTSDLQRTALAAESGT